MTRILQGLFECFARGTSESVFAHHNMSFAGSAAWVIITDVEWNPSYDAQAQDRSYRIGQSQDVKVFRLVSRGTIEELKYLRQVYKTQLQSETLADHGSGRDTSKRLFRGVADDVDRRGELFGLANLTKFRDSGTFMDYGPEATEARQFNSSMFNMDSFLSVAQTFSEDIAKQEELDAIEFSGLVKPAENPAEAIATENTPDRITEPSEPGTQMLGGESQGCLDICNEMPIQSDGENQRAPNDIAERTKIQEQSDTIRRAKPLSRTRTATRANSQEIAPDPKMQTSQLPPDRKATKKVKVKKPAEQSSDPKTTFSASDLALPSGFRKKKRKKAI